MELILDKKNKSKKIYNKIYYIELIFKITFLFYTVFGTNSFTNGRLPVKITFWISITLGIIILIFRLIHYKNYIKMPALQWLVLLMFSIGLSTIINYSYSFKENIIFCIYWTFNFFILYTIENNKDIEQIKKELNYFFTFLICYMSFGNIISLYLLINDINLSFIAQNGYKFYAGINNGRLWGTYINPNFAAVASAIAFACCIYKFRRVKSIIIKVLLMVSGILQIIYIALSDSRTGTLCFGIVIASMYFFYVFYYSKNKKKIVRTILLLLTCVVLILACFVPRKTQDIYNTIVLSQLNQKPNNKSKSQDNKSKSQDNKSKSQKAVIKRNYDMSEDFSNNRFTLWKSGLEIFLTSPIYGTSFNGIDEYCDENLPNTYFIAGPDGRYSTLDNELINILVSQGIIGLVSLILLIINVLKKIFKCMFRLPEKEYCLVSMMFSCIIGLTVASMTASIMFYHLSHNMFTFWTLLGSTVYVCEKTNCDKLEG